MKKMIANRNTIIKTKYKIAKILKIFLQQIQVLYDITSNIYDVNIIKVAFYSYVACLTILQIY